MYSSQNFPVATILPQNKAKDSLIGLFTTLIYFLVTLAFTHSTPTFLVLLQLNMAAILLQEIPIF